MWLSGFGLALKSILPHSTPASVCAKVCRTDVLDLINISLPTYSLKV